MTGGFFDQPAHTLRADGFDASEDGTGRGTPLVPIPFDTTHITSPTNRSNPQIGDPCHHLAAQAHVPAIAFSCKDYGADAGDISPTLRSMGHDKSHANAGGQVAVAMNLRGRDGGAMPELSDLASLRAADGGSSRSYVLQDVADTLTSSWHESNGATPGNNVGLVNAVLSGWRVRRITPREAERLQGFPDDFTLVPYRGRMMADGPRYKMLGNSMAVPVVRKIGERIAMVDRLTRSACIPCEGWGDYLGKTCEQCDGAGVIA
ncbi:DNA cytosine methyltransferase [Silvibacterium acidisoli]|uniref:DNA cytosine methyltransferase n=1 Tax=Acidobacteriaceae bacterium ZG23-2 TaxID=2883246 RepID=UPI00406CDAD7